MTGARQSMGHTVGPRHRPLPQDAWCTPMSRVQSFQQQLQLNDTFQSPQALKTLLPSPQGHPMRMELCSHFSDGKTGTLRVNKPERSRPGLTPGGTGLTPRLLAAGLLVTTQDSIQPLNPRLSSSQPVSPPWTWARRPFQAASPDPGRSALITCLQFQSRT